MEQVETIPSYPRRKYGALVEQIEKAAPGIYEIDYRQYGPLIQVRNGLRYYGYNVKQRGTQLLVVIEDGS